MKIGVDIDNTLVALQEGFCKFYKLNYNGYLSVDDCEKYWLSEVLNIPKEKEYPLWKEYHDSDLFDEIDFMDGAKEVINTLKQKNKIIFITSRHLEWKQKTLDFIKKHFPADNVRKVNCTLQCADSCEQLSFSEHPENPKQTAPFKVRYTQGFLDFQIIFSGDVYGGKCKEEICRELDIPVIIEDHHEKSIDYANAGIKVILFNRPWNKKLSHENITRVKNWGEILEEIEKLV